MPRELADGHDYRTARRNLLISSSVLIFSKEVVFLSDVAKIAQLEIVFSQERMKFYAAIAVVYCILNLFVKIASSVSLGDFSKKGQAVELLSNVMPLLYAAYALFLEKL